jgi:hypothetical protein
VGIYITIFLLICHYLSGGWEFLWGVNKEYNLLFVSGALLLVFGTYVAEPYFTKPVDVLTNSIAVILALLSINQPNNFVGYWYIFYSSLLLVLISIILIFIYQLFPEFEKTEKTFYEFIVKIGQSKVIFSVIYIATLFSYFKSKPLDFAFLFTFWIIFITNYIVEDIIIWFSNLLRISKNNNEILGEAIGCENPFLYKVEIDFLKHKSKETKKGKLVYLYLDKSIGAVGIIVNEKQLLNKKWIYVYLLEEKKAPLRVDLKGHKFVSGSKTIFSRNNSVFILDLTNIEEESKKLIEENYLYKNKDNFIGYVADGSNISKIQFLSLIDTANINYRLLKEGSVIKTEIYNKDVLYQIIDGKTNEEELEKHNIYGYLTGVAQKLGSYNDQLKELETVKWLPNIYSPVFFDKKAEISPNPMAIGRLPETSLEILLKDPDSLVTHNTAILGILGIGKSCLTYELIKKIAENTETKIICLDITNEYKKALPDYLDGSVIKSDDEHSLDELNSNFGKIHYDKNSSNQDVANYEKSGNHNQYHELLEKDLNNFFFSQDTIPQNKKFAGDYRVRIYNPDYHKVSKGEKVGFNVITTELTQAEKTRIISEEIFKILMAMGLEENKKAKVLIIFEEAHSLVPEWNSTANEGDKTAVNGTAKVILQGRKYGLGSIVITQRTANISKSILNQCNTIFAMRVFDDTGKQFLENYIGLDYSNTLSTLEERHAIVVGKALKLKQPVIIRLNDSDKIKIPKI